LRSLVDKAAQQLRKTASLRQRFGVFDLVVKLVGAEARHVYFEVLAKPLLAVVFLLRELPERKDKRHQLLKFLHYNHQVL